MNQVRARAVTICQLRGYLLMWPQSAGKAVNMYDDTYARTTEALSIRVACLEAGTCAHEVAKSLGKPLSYATFEAAADAVVAGEADAMVLPAAYPEYHTIVYRNIGYLHPRATLIVPTPEFILAAPDNAVAGGPSGARLRIATHPSPEPLLHQLGGDYHKVQASSNLDAALMVLWGRADYCVTQTKALEAANASLDPDDPRPRLSAVVHFGSQEMVWVVLQRGQRKLP